MQNGIPNDLERRRPILLVCDATNHLVNRMMAGAIDARSGRDAIELLVSLWVSEWKVREPCI